jgi:hypothetical protein
MDLSLSDKAKLAEHLKKCLVILPNDEYLKELAKKLTDDLLPRCAGVINY